MNKNKLGRPRETVKRTGSKEAKMREIKFRAWEKKNKRMAKRFYQPTLHNEWDLFNFSKFINSWKDSDYILMQYTGLKDKNGKEVYEGDIFELDDDRRKGNRGEVLWVEKNVMFILFGYAKYGREGSFIIDQPWTEIKVIGNIYENPGLILRVG